jgi:SAM-dependent methyltransferase
VSVAGQIRHCLVCDAETVRDRGVRRVMRDVFGTRTGPFRRGREPEELRRRWATAVSLRAYGALGLLRDEMEVLAVGPGLEEAIYWLTRRTHRVFATDLALADGAWDGNGIGPVLLDPGRQSSFPWNPRRLVVQPMPPGELRYDDGSLDVLLCANTFERTTGRAHAAAMAGELHRVLKPGGVAAVSLALRVDGDPGSSPRTFDEAELRGLLLSHELSWAASDPFEIPSPVTGPLSHADGRAWTTAHLLLVKPLYH